jgi:hypothetical protein
VLTSKCTQINLIKNKKDLKSITKASTLGQQEKKSKLGPKKENTTIKAEINQIRNRKWRKFQNQKLVL